MDRNNKSIKGFTIIELLVVIVVIAILAAIVMVAYPQVIARANESAVKAELAQVTKKLELYKVDNNVYPDKIDCDNPVPPNVCIRVSSTLVLKYKVSETKIDYALNISKDDTSYFVSSSSTTPSKSDINADDIIIQPAIIPNLIISNESGLTFYNNLYFNPEPSQPSIDNFVFIGVKVGPSQTMMAKYVIASNAKTSDNPATVVIVGFNNLSLEPDISSSDFYIYVWDDVTDDILDIGLGNFDYKKGWNKLQVRGITKTLTKIDYNGLPELNEEYVFIKDQEAGTGTSETGKYCNIVPYVYKF